MWINKRSCDYFSEDFVTDVNRTANETAVSANQTVISHTDQYYNNHKRNETNVTANSVDDYLQAYITNTGLAISVVSLVLHLVVFFATPKLMNLPAMNLASLSTSLLLLYCCFISSEFTVPPCAALAVIMHYSLIASFTWMLVIAFDILKTIRDSVRSLKTNSGNLHITLYMLKEYVAQISMNWF